jgi:hypothetical protein
MLELRKITLYLYLVQKKIAKIVEGYFFIFKRNS